MIQHRDPPANLLQPAELHRLVELFRDQCGLPVEVNGGDGMLQLTTQGSVLFTLFTNVGCAELEVDGWWHLHQQSVSKAFEIVASALVRCGHTGLLLKGYNPAVLCWAMTKGGHRLGDRSVEFSPTALKTIVSSSFVREG